MPDVCIWEDNGDQYNTSCGEIFYYNDNKEFKFCPYCGKEIELKV